MASLTLRMKATRLGEKLGPSGVRGQFSTLSSSTANSTLMPELQEAEVFIMDNKKCDQIYRKKSSILHIVPLVLEDMICATNYGENLCYVGFGEALAALLLLGTPGLGDGSLGRGLLGLPPCHHCQALLCSRLFPPESDFA